MNKPHKHSKLIKTWADGAEIEYYNIHHNVWQKPAGAPIWDEATQYRIKPEPTTKKVKLLAFIVDGELKWFIEGEAVPSTRYNNVYKVHSEDKEVELCTD